MPISYAGREFDEGKKITWRDGFAALWTLRQVPLSATDPRHRLSDARWAAVVVNYEAGDRCSTRCVRSVLADTSAGPVELVVVDNGSTDGSVDALLAAHPDVRVVARAGQRRLRARREPRHRGDARRRSSRC